MLENTTRLRIAIILTLLFSSAAASYYFYFSDPYRNYRTWEISNFAKTAQSVMPVDLKNNQNIERSIREKLSLSPSARESAILSGIHWLLQFIDSDDNFNDVFSDFIILAYELSRAKNRAHQAAVAKLLLKQSLRRAQDQLPLLFPNDEQGRWDFIGILPIIAQTPEFQASYFDFYRKQFGDEIPEGYSSGNMDFKKAVQLNDYEIIGDYLIDTSFLHYYLKMTSASTAHTDSIILPPDNFQAYLMTFESFDYNFAHPIDSDKFSELAYLATHVVLVLTNYGEFKIQPGIIRDKVNDFVRQTYQAVRYQLNDLDLLAEYLQCLKILNEGDEQLISETEDFLLSLQRPDGSWGTKNDFQQEPYIIFHPTWAVLTALNH